MDISSIKKIGVIGAGQMGNGITQVAAAQNLDVVMFDISAGSGSSGGSVSCSIGISSGKSTVIGVNSLLMSFGGSSKKSSFPLVNVQAMGPRGIPAQLNVTNIENNICRLINSQLRRYDVVSFTSSLSTIDT